VSAPEFARERSHHGRGAGAGTATEAGRDENHVRAFKRFNNFVRIFERGFAANLGIGARAEAFRSFARAAASPALAKVSATANRYSAG